MYNAVVAIDQAYDPYQFHYAPTPDTSPDTAASVAAHDVLTHLFPSLASNFDTALNNRLNAIPDGAGKTSGIALGHTAADDIIALRIGDGSDAPADYTPGTEPGQWHPTPPNNTPALSPQWGNVTPWTMTAGSQFRPPPPPALDSDAYAAAFNDVKEKGTRVGGTRTEEEVLISSFWANDRDGTYKPPGHLNQMAQVLSIQEGLNLQDEARLFAMLNIAMADAGITAWDAKYATSMDLWRPIEGIRRADEDGNPDTLADSEWEPWSNEPNVNGFTPPFPAYISGHSTFGAVASAIFRNFFGTDDMTFTLGTDDPYFNDPMLFPVPYTRTFDSFTEAALENGRSRIYLGVHWQFDADFGYITGTALGDYLSGHYFQPVPEPGTLAIVLATGAWGLVRRRRES
jgi:hypothetical protein